MDLHEIDLKNYGHFSKSKKASFTITSLNLPTAWDYIYQNQKMLLRVDQLGFAYAQAFPPNDIVMFMRDRFQKYSVWLTWLASDEFADGPFSNFFRPSFGGKNPAAEPDKVEITFSPSHAKYLIEHQGLRVVTEIFLPADLPSICQSVKITNLRKRPIRLSAFPALRHACQWADGAAWDKPEWYLKTGFFKDGSRGAGFHIHVTSPSCDISRRRAVSLWSDPADLSHAEVSYEKFVGQGSFENPEAIHRGKLEMGLKCAKTFGTFDKDNHVFSYPPVCALQYDYKINPKETKEFRQVLSWIETIPDGLLPSVEIARESAVYLNEKACAAEMKKLETKFNHITSVRSIHTSDESLNRYVNEWLPLQLEWVCALDRGWPTGLRGGRDAANDFTAMIGINPQWTMQIILTQLSCQCTDGRIPRHFSAKGHSGKERDYRNACDAGAWVLEMVYEYLCHTKDFGFLDEQIPWLDQDASKTDSVWEHLVKAMGYSLSPQNIGEHGLVKLWEGEWLDTVNRAGTKGRGEGVMITNQVIMALEWMAQIADKLDRLGKLSKEGSDWLVRLYREKREFFSENLRRHAFNKEGYFNGFFNDDGKWIFSDNDPDGQRRVYGAANWWSIISGVAVPDLVKPCLKEMKFLKCDGGYMLNWPPFIYGPVPNVGRMASGDSPAGRSEHANPYNQGSHGFLGRALSVVGKGDLLYQVFRLMLPYDQSLHPIDQTMSAPYANVNVWQRVPRFMNRSLMTFLTGSIAYSIRMAYDWMFGIQPTLDGLAIDPCMPTDFKNPKATFQYLGKKIELEIVNKNGKGVGVKSLKLNGKPIEAKQIDPFSRRERFVIEEDMLKKGTNKIGAIL